MLKERNHTIDFLRFFAATMVVFFHFNDPKVFIENWYGNIVEYGWLGVPVFFVISGYCILLTANTSKNGFDFLLKRFFRIYPTYWLSLGIVLLIVIIRYFFYGVNDIVILPKTLYGIISTIVLNTDPISKVIGINWVYWSLACEICFYILIGLGLMIFRKHLKLFLIFTVLVSIFINGLSKGVWWYFLKEWPCFALGISVYYFHTCETKKDTSMAFSIFALSTIAIFVQNPINLSVNKQYITVSFLSFLIILLSNKFKLKRNFLSSLGDYSYAIYLIHVPIGVYFLGYFKRDIIQIESVRIYCLYVGFDILNYILVCLLSILIFKFIEKPTIKFGKSLSAKMFRNRYFNAPIHHKQPLPLP